MHVRSLAFVVVAASLRQGVAIKDADHDEGLVETRPSGPLNTLAALTFDVVPDSLNKVPVGSLVSMNKEWDNRQKKAIDDWYQRDDPQKWATNALGLRTLEMVFFYLSNSDLFTNDQGCAWTDKDGRETKETKNQDPMKLKWDLYYAAHYARRHRVTFEECYNTQSPIQMGHGGFSGDQRLIRAQGFVATRAQQVMRCAVETMEDIFKRSELDITMRYSKPYKIASFVSETLSEYGRKYDPVLSYEMSEKLLHVPFEDAPPCASGASWALGIWNLHCKDECTMNRKTSGASSARGGKGAPRRAGNGDPIIDFPGRSSTDKVFAFNQPWHTVLNLTATYRWEMSVTQNGGIITMGGMPNWKVNCVNDVAAAISLDKGEHWYTWSGFDGTYYADFYVGDIDGWSTTHGPMMSMYSYMKKA